MTVPSATNRVNYTGNGVTTAFAFPYIFYDEDHIKVYFDGVLQSSGYVVTGAGSESGGTVTFTPAPSADVSILIRRVVGYTQDTDFENFDGNPSDVTEKQFDLLAMQTQQLADESVRSLKLREDDPTTSIELPLVADRANMFLAFDSLGNPTASAGATSTGTTFGATGEDLAATATPALARSVLELGTMATQTASSVAITGGAISGITDLALADGGTGASSAAGAYNNIAASFNSDRVLYGLTLSNHVSDATNDIDIAAGACVSDDGTTVISLSAITKRLDAAWAVGTNQGGLDTGAIANTTYHVWAIKRPDTDVSDVTFSTSASDPTLNAAYTKKKCIGSIVRTGGAIKAFTQYGNYFEWTAPVVDVAAQNPGTSAVTRTLTLPTGVKLRARVNCGIYSGTTGSVAGYVSSLDQTDLAPQVFNTASLTGQANFHGCDTGTSWNFNPVDVWTNTSAQVRSRIGTSGALDRIGIITQGWMDPRI
jgi:hypothetical protein